MSAEVKACHVLTWLGLTVAGSNLELPHAKNTSNIAKCSSSLPSMKLKFCKHITSMTAEIKASVNTP